MPELPEVETVKNYIAPLITGKKFSEVKIIKPNLRITIPNDLPKIATEQTIQKVTRRAKYIVINLENQQNIILHLGMTGKIFAKQQKPQITKHDHLLFSLNDQSYLIFNDVRKFGLVTYAADTELKTHKLFNHLGIEPLVSKFTGAYLLALCKGKDLAIKKLIMEQKNVVGVGNIYASEALFLSGVHPELAAKELNLAQAELLVKNIKKVLKAAIKAGGSTIKDYQLVNGESGYFQHSFKVYGRENKPCKACETPIKRIVQAGRSTFYCESCQKK